MKKFLLVSCFVTVLIALTACSDKQGNAHKFIGKFTDEFGNKFELREDKTATIVFAGLDDKVVETTWSNGEGDSLPYATIAFNGDPTSYFLRDGVLYRDRQHMDDGAPAIQITWDE